MLFVKYVMIELAMAYYTITRKDEVRQNGGDKKSISGFWGVREREGWICGAKGFLGESNYSV